VYYVQRVGVGEIATGIGRLGWLFSAVVALAGLRFAVRAMAWRACLDGTHKLTPGRAFQAAVAGDTLGNLTPLSLLVGEPAKALFARDCAPISRTLAALTVENLFYTLSAALVIAGGAFALVMRMRTTETWWLASVALATALICLILLAHVIMWRRVRVASGLVEFLVHRGLATQLVARGAEHVRSIEDRVYKLYPREPYRLIKLACWEFSFHGLAILEIYIILSLISDVTPTLLDAFVFESTNRFITALFKVVPMRIGVDEAGTAAFAELLNFGTATGVTLAIVRKVRMLVWMTIGVGFFVSRGLSVRRTIKAAKTTGVVNRESESSFGTTQGAVIAVMTRSPDSTNPPKTRLASVVLDEHSRERLHAAFLADVIAVCETVDRVTVRVAYTGEGETDSFGKIGVNQEQLIPQRGSDFGSRERNVFEDLFRAGFSPVVIVGSDIPTLPARFIAEAIDRLGISKNRVVLGPANDGGYYLIGLTARSGNISVPDLFTDIRWSTKWTLADTKTAAKQCGLNIDLIDEWYDIDNENDLNRLRNELASEDGAGLAPATKRVIGELLGVI